MVVVAVALIFGAAAGLPGVTASGITGPPYSTIYPVGQELQELMSESIGPSFHKPFVKAIAQFSPP